MSAAILVGPGSSRSRPAHGSQLAAISSTAEEPVAAVGFESGYARALWHFNLFQNLARSRIDAPYFAFLAFPSAVPEFAVNPCHSGNEAVRLDGAKDVSGFRIDLMDLAFAILPDPERTFAPREA